ncbi:Rab proteins geranylgeranyltransferase component A [Collariella sp. IMI 366227]|nr:Rab proteins geranylgeranyltransferase component A [Collariella sp. IMI 366227]
MESLSDTLWDVVISGTGLQQSLLALALSRSGKKILHIDPNEYYGGAEAAFTLQDAASWVERVSAGTGGLFDAASIAEPEVVIGLSSRAYSLALAPRLVHARSALLSQLVSSRAYRQVEFLAVGSFFIFKPSQHPSETPTLARIPSTREEVFSTTAIPTKAKRTLMKFLKFVLDYESSPQLESWQPHADAPLTDLLQTQFKMDAELQTYIVTLTLSLDGKISTRDGLAVIRRHLSSMGVYMLGIGIKETEPAEDGVKIHLTSGDTVKTRMLVQSDDSPSTETGISKLVTVVDSPLRSLFEAVVEGAPRPAVAIIAFPAGKASKYPVYLSAHSSDTGECPNGQSTLYLTTLTTSDSKEILQLALDGFLRAVSEGQPPQTLYKLQYDQLAGSQTLVVEGSVLTLPAPSFSLSFEDSTLEPVKQTWKHVMGDAAVEAEYMTFADREGAVDDDDIYE